MPNKQSQCTGKVGPPCPVADDRIFAPISFTRSSRTVQALYDTGAAVSCIGTDTFDQADRAKCIIRELDHPGINLHSASGSSMPATGVFLIRFSLNNRTLTAPFVRVPSLNAPAILGINVIRRYGIVPDTDKGVTFASQVAEITPSFSEGGHAVATSEVHVGPFQAALVRAQLYSQEYKRVHAEVDAVVTIDAIPLGVSSTRGGVVQFYVKNPTPFERIISRNEFLGTAEPLLAGPSADLHSLRASVAGIHKAGEKDKASKPMSSNMRKRLTKAVSAFPKAYREQALKIFQTFHDVFSESRSDLGKGPHEHTIDLKSPDPTYSRQFTIPSEHMDCIKSHVKEWLKLGIVEPSKSPFNAPIFCVPKKEGQGMRVVLDYRKLNQASLPDKYSIRCVEECINEIGKFRSAIFSTLDLTSGFWQMPLAQAARRYTAFTIPGWGQFQWRRGAMGLQGCPASFARMMDVLFADYDHIVAYIDDLLVHSSTWDEHLLHLTQAFRVLRQHGLKLNLEKCFFGRDKVEYLGHTISARGVTPGMDKTKAIRLAPLPSSVRDVKSFLGLANFFRAYIQDFSKVALPLFELTRQDSPWKSGPLPEGAAKAFRYLQEKLTSAPILAFPTQRGEFHLYTDASGGVDGSEGAFGAALTQVQDGKKRVIAFASRRLKTHERNYSAFLLEQAGVVFGVEHFRQYLLGRKFAVFTDHKPITALSKVHQKTFSRFSETLLDFNFDIRYVPGKDNTVADFLSRSGWIEADRVDGLGVAPLDDGHQRIVLAQKDDALCKELRSAASETHKEEIRKKYRIQGWNDTMGVLRISARPRKGFPTMRDRVVAPQVLRPFLIKQGHDAELAGHGGFFKTRERIANDFWWPLMDKDVEAHVQACDPCKQAGRHAPAPSTGISPLPQPVRPNDRIHVDLFGPLLNEKQEKRFVLVITDAFTKIVRLRSIPDKQSKTVADAIVRSWIYIFGVPRTIFSDQGREFCNTLAKDLWDSLKVDHKTTTPYHPQTNSMAEVFNKTMGAYLRTMIAANDNSIKNWEILLGPLMLAHNTAVHKATRVTPFYSMFGYDPRIPLWPDMTVLDDSLRRQAKGSKREEEDFLQDFHDRQTQARRITQQNNTMERERYAKAPDVSEPIFHPGQKVWIRATIIQGFNAKLRPRWEKAIIMNEPHPNVFKVRRFKGKRRTKTINHAAIRPRVDGEEEPQETEEEPEDQKETEQQEEVPDDPDEPEEANEVMAMSLSLAEAIPLWLSQMEFLSMRDLNELFRRLPQKDAPLLFFLLNHAGDNLQPPQMIQDGGPAPAQQAPADPPTVQAPQIRGARARSIPMPTPMRSRSPLEQRSRSPAIKWLMQRANKAARGIQRQVARTSTPRVGPRGELPKIPEIDDSPIQGPAATGNETPLLRRPQRSPFTTTPAEKRPPFRIPHQAQPVPFPRIPNPTSPNIQQGTKRPMEPGAPSGFTPAPARPRIKTATPLPLSPSPEQNRPPGRRPHQAQPVPFPHIPTPANIGQGTKRTIPPSAKSGLTPAQSRPRTHEQSPPRDRTRPEDPEWSPHGEDLPSSSDSDIPSPNALRQGFQTISRFLRDQASERDKRQTRGKDDRHKESRQTE